MTYFDSCQAGALSRLIIVPGHAVLIDVSEPMSDASWTLLPFQRGEPPKYIEHIRAGVEAAAGDETALLVFSGGQSRREAGPRSEAHSYFSIAEHYDYFGKPAAAARVVTEEFARDSFENLLFSVCRFRECTGRFPEHVTFVGWAFKQERFELHREAIRWPKERYSYLGVNNPDALEQALAAEQATARGYTADPYSGSADFRQKKDSRNPFLRQHGYFTSCPELADLFLHSGPELFSGPLPWI